MTSPAARQQARHPHNSQQAKTGKEPSNRQATTSWRRPRKSQPVSSKDVKLIEFSGGLGEGVRRIITRGERLRLRLLCRRNHPPPFQTAFTRWVWSTARWSLSRATLPERVLVAGSCKWLRSGGPVDGRRASNKVVSATDEGGVRRSSRQRTPQRMGPCMQYVWVFLSTVPLYRTLLEGFLPSTTRCHQTGGREE